jgi:hypothetical protein
MTWLQITRSAGATSASSQVLATMVTLSRAGMCDRMPSDGSTAVTHSRRSASGVANRPAPAPTSMSVFRGDRNGSRIRRKSSTRAPVERAKLAARRSQ